jgi:ABC-type uncharacterized transport system involved in gliding motility auxiliary subunit
MVVHPKNLSQPTLFAIEQYILKGGRAIICVDPHCFSDNSNRMSGGMMMASQNNQSSDLNVLLKTWGIEMPQNQFAGDLNLAVNRPVRANAPSQPIIGLLDLKQDSFNRNNVITAQLNGVRVLFSGVLNDITDPNMSKSDDSKIKRTPLLMTTDKGNSFEVTNSYEFMVFDPAVFMQKFIPGTKPVTMGYFLTGRFKSSFPDGIEIKNDSAEPDDPNAPLVTKKITGLTQAKEDCAVAVFADVDFISDALAYQDFLGFGKAPMGDNSTLLFNTIDDLSGSSDLISVRSRGSVKRPFIVVDEIEKKAQAETAQQLELIDAAIVNSNARLQSIKPSGDGDQELINSQITKEIRQLEEEIYQNEKMKRAINMKKSEQIDMLGKKLMRANTIYVPIVILLFAIVLWLWRSLRKRHYISHTSDA